MWHFIKSPPFPLIPSDHSGRCVNVQQQIHGQFRPWRCHRIRGQHYLPQRPEIALRPKLAIAGGMHGQIAPLAPEAGKALGRIASLLAHNTLGIPGQIALAQMVKLLAGCAVQCGHIGGCLQRPNYSKPPKVPHTKPTSRQSAKAKSCKNK